MPRAPCPVPRAPCPVPRAPQLAPCVLSLAPFAQDGDVALHLKDLELRPEPFNCALLPRGAPLRVRSVSIRRLIFSLKVGVAGNHHSMRRLLRQPPPIVSRDVSS